jgi:surfeit locus 1 family protein
MGSDPISRKWIRPPIAKLDPTPFWIEYIVSKPIKAQILGWIPYVIGVILVVQFAGLGVWQVSRGLEKSAEQHAFNSQAGFTAWSDGMEVRSFQKLKATGHFESARQVLLENIIINSRLGYYVLSPLRVADDVPLLLVNRGWFERSSEEPDSDSLALPPNRVTVLGRAGSLPKAGYRMGEAIPADVGWPKLAVYPTLDELAATLGEPVQPFILLLDPNDDYGFLRNWVPEEMGPGRHYAYALQWFAMGIVLAGLLIWNYRKRGLES